MMFNNKRDAPGMMRTVYGLTMGILWTGVGLFFIFSRKLGYDILNGDTLLTNIFGGAAILYGVFRIYRGIKNK